MMQVSVEQLDKLSNWKNAVKKKIYYEYNTRINVNQLKTWRIHSGIDKTIITKIDKKKETKNIAKNGDVIITGVKGEFYTMPIAKFLKLYKIQDSGIAVTLPDKRKVQTIDVSTVKKLSSYSHSSLPKESTGFTFIAPWGEEMIANIGDILVKEDKGKYYRVEREAFNDTYDILHNNTK